MTGEGLTHTFIETVPPSAGPFYTALGHALTQWQLVENALCNVFEKVSTCTIEKVATAIFFSDHDFSVKLSMVDSAAQSSLKPELLSKWGALRKRAKDEAEVRNALAHFSVQIVSIGESKAGEELKVSTRLLLVPNWYDPNSSKKKEGPKWTKEPQDTSKLKRSCARFQRLTADLRKFADETHLVADEDTLRTAES
jgi:hypothetical protein